MRRTQEIIGKITATSGSIGSWTITSTSLKCESRGNGHNVILSGSDYDFPADEGLTDWYSGILASYTGNQPYYKENYDLFLDSDGDVYCKRVYAKQAIYCTDIFHLGINSVSINVYGNFDMQGNYYVVNQSDSRLKEDILPSHINGLDIVDSIAVKSFKWKKNGSKVYAGFIAQDVEALETEFKDSGYETIVTDGEDGYKRITYDKLIPILWKAVQELSSEVKSLRDRYEDK